MSGDVVDVWSVTLDHDDATAAALSATLADDERARARALAFPRDRRRFAVAHAALREILANRLGAAPADIEFVRGCNGKPAVGGSSIEFSLSHSAGLALIAVSPTRPVGVDVERIHANVMIEAIAARHFGSRESTWIARAKPHESLGRFFRVWTWKESCLKADGRGLAGLAEVHLDPGDLPLLRAGGWWIVELPVPSGYAAALATANTQSHVSHRWTPTADVET